MCDYDDSLENWDDVKTNIVNTFKSIRTVFSTASKHLNKWYSKGNPSMPTQTELANTCISAFDACTEVSTSRPKCSRDYLSFQQFRSPVDSRNNRKERRSKAYGITNRNPSDDPLRITGKYFTDIKNFLGFYDSMFYFRHSANIEYDKAHPRLSLINLLNALEQIPSLRAELEKSFPGCNIYSGNEMSSDIAFGALWNYFFIHPIRKTNSLVYSQKERAKKLLKCPEIITSIIKQSAGVSNAYLKPDGSVYVICNVESATTQIYEDIYTVVRSLFSEIETDDKLLERTLLPSIIPEITVALIADDIVFEEQLLAMFPIVNMGLKEAMRRIVRHPKKDRVSISTTPIVTLISAYDDFRTLEFYVAHYEEVRNTIQKYEKCGGIKVEKTHESWLKALRESSLQLIDGTERSLLEVPGYISNELIGQVNEIHQDFNDGACWKYPEKVKQKLARLSAGLAE